MDPSTARSSSAPVSSSSPASSSVLAEGGHRGSATSRRAPGKHEWKHYNFVEVGTSNFRTLCQYVDGSDRTCTLGEFLPTLDKRKCRGIAVEPVAHLLRELPDFDGLRKVPVALGESDGTAKLHVVPEEHALLSYREYQSASWENQSWALYLATGTSRTGEEPHPEL